MISVVASNIAPNVPFSFTFTGYIILCLIAVLFILAIAKICKTRSLTATQKILLILATLCFPILGAVVSLVFIFSIEKKGSQGTPSPRQ